MRGVYERKELKKRELEHQVGEDEDEARACCSEDLATCSDRIGRALVQPGRATAARQRVSPWRHEMAQARLGGAGQRNSAARLRSPDRVKAGRRTGTLRVLEPVHGVYVQLGAAGQAERSSAGRAEMRTITARKQVVRRCSRGWVDA